MFISRKSKERFETLEKRIADLEREVQSQRKRMENHIKQKEHGSDDCPF